MPKHWHIIATGHVSQHVHTLAQVYQLSGISKHSLCLPILNSHAQKAEIRDSVSLLGSFFTLTFRFRLMHNYTHINVPTLQKTFNEKYFENLLKQERTHLNTRIQNCKLSIINIIFIWGRTFIRIFRKTQTLHHVQSALRRLGARWSGLKARLYQLLCDLGQVS